MIVIVCLDKKNGMLFNNRRQSADSVLREHIIKMCNGKKLWMNRYSEQQFHDFSEYITVSEKFLEKAGENEYCFVEDCSLKPYVKKIKRVIVYHWNREYPSDQKIDIDLKKWRRVTVRDFEGNSHKKITEEILE